MKVTLINPYELGRQPFGLAEPAAWLERDGCVVNCCDMSIDRLDAHLDERTGLVAVYLAMHTATRIAVEAMPKIRRLAPNAHLCVYGLYAPMNRDLFMELGVDTVIGGEYEQALHRLARRLQHGAVTPVGEPEINLDKTPFIVPQRAGLPPLSRYATLLLPDGSTRTCGFAETTRGCKYLCRHCPVVPVYDGRFFVIPVDVVLADVRNQVAAGAQHISFGDPDFFNGPGHALRIVRALHDEFPGLTYDATIKVEHLVKYPAALAELRDTGCLFILSAVESFDDRVLSLLDKGHTRADFEQALATLRSLGIALAPTFVAFTPWTTLAAYLDLLQTIVRHGLVEAVAPVQLSIRLLIPAGSRVLDIDGLETAAADFDRDMLGYRWRNPDPRVDALQRSIQSWIEQAEAAGLDRMAVFQGIWQRAHAAAGIEATDPDAAAAGPVIPRLSENWYCCAEPTREQLGSV